MPAFAGIIFLLKYVLNLLGIDYRYSILLTQKRHKCTMSEKSLQFQKISITLILGHNCIFFCDTNASYIVTFYNKLIYEGELRTYSFVADNKEMLFFNGKVFDFSGNLQSKAPYIYVSCHKDDVRLEFFNKGEQLHA